MKSRYQDLSFPPRTGTYDSKGKVSEIGELTRTFLAVTFQEVRAFLRDSRRTSLPRRLGYCKSTASRAAWSPPCRSSTYLRRSMPPLEDPVWRSDHDRYGPAPRTTPDWTTIEHCWKCAGGPIFATGVKTDRAMRIRVTAAGVNVARSDRLRYHHVCFRLEGLVGSTSHSGHRLLSRIPGKRSDFHVLRSHDDGGNLGKHFSDVSVIVSGVAMPTPISDEIKKLTTDPGARRWASYLTRSRTDSTYAAHHRSAQSGPQGRGEVR